MWQPLHEGSPGHSLNSHDPWGLCHGVASVTRRMGQIYFLYSKQAEKDESPPCNIKYIQKRVLDPQYPKYPEDGIRQIAIQYQSHREHLKIKVSWCCSPSSKEEEAASWCPLLTVRMKLRNSCRAAAALTIPALCHTNASQKLQAPDSHYWKSKLKPTFCRKLTLSCPGFTVTSPGPLILAL